MIEPIIILPIGNHIPWTKTKWNLQFTLKGGFFKKKNFFSENRGVQGFFFFFNIVHISGVLVC